MARRRDAGRDPEKKKVDEEETEKNGAGEMRDGEDGARIEGAVQEEEEGAQRKGGNSKGEEADRNVPDDESGPRA